ncbi:MAG: hypothetical protein KDK30_02405 [Leptospiraceae bacterium]|nr:hypothetical protein [Leptospiraceae bacterium]MCB1321126.1 hypothetical protein [Leptospiraceae bacterium]
MLTYSVGIQNRITRVFMINPSQKHFSLTILDSFVRDQLKGFSDDLEGQLKIDGLSHTLHFVLLELVRNAVKANLKRVFFQQHKYNIHDTDAYHRGLKDFIQHYQNINESDYRSALEELNFHVEVRSDLNKDRLLIFVENNSLLHAEEELRIRRQLAASAGIKNIVNFSVEYGDETEGRGLGLAMIVLLIRDMGFDPEHFRVYHTDGKTTARIEFPLSANYIPLRERYEREMEMKSRNE